MPNTNAKELRSQIDVLKSNAGFDKLQAMRESNQNGAGLGQVSNIELHMLQSAIANLDQGRDPEALRASIMDVVKLYQEISSVGLDNSPLLRARAKKIPQERASGMSGGSTNKTSNGVEWRVTR